MTFKLVLKIFGIIAILITITPIFALDYWWIRIFDFPHTQLTFLTALAILVYFIKFDFKNEGDYAFVLILVACFVFQFVKIYPFTLFAGEELKPSSKNVTTQISFLTANVYQDNEDTQKIIKAIDDSDADVMVLTEANNRWRDVISQAISDDYKYQIEFPLDNTYGMLLYSKLKLVNPEVKFLINDSIPSIHSKLVITSGDTIQLYAIHPTPPMPQHNPMSTDRDTEMMLVAKKVIDSKLPVVVLGDFNDVSWSKTNQLFKRNSMLLDPRIGRGIYSTYNAQKFLLRWPLDHIFCSKEFRFKDFKTYDETSSDHFPLYAKFSFEPDKASEQEPESPSESDKKQLQEQLTKISKKSD
ncbi:endonuclease/exonuclease/phosphatase family protein [Psychroserpens sp. BH13MA-6]